MVAPAASLSVEGDDRLLAVVVRQREVDDLVALVGDAVLLEVEVVVLVAGGDGLVEAGADPGDLVVREAERLGDLVHDGGLEAFAALRCVVDDVGREGRLAGRHRQHARPRTRRRCRDHRWPGRWWRRERRWRRSCRPWSRRSCPAVVSPVVSPARGLAGRGRGAGFGGLGRSLGRSSAAAAVVSTAAAAVVSTAAAAVVSAAAAVAAVVASVPVDSSSSPPQAASARTAARGSTNFFMTQQVRGCIGTLRSPLSQVRRTARTVGRWRGAGRRRSRTSPRSA